jgi:poly(hydroxyalkanoate) depolymerase family esterase
MELTGSAMRVLGRAFAGLKRLSDEAMRSTPAAREPPRVLTEVIRFGTNPGNLRMFAFVPDRLAPSRPLVLVLHGCTQTAAGYDEGAGWSTLAERYGFALVFAQQKRANNLRTCFNWFQPEDVGRDRGEALSIRQMVEHMVERHRLGRGQAYVTGLSAGGAMTMVMLAAYPDVFAGGAVIAGLPYGCAGNAREALACMFQGCARSPEDWGDRVRAAAGRRGPWPKLSVWHGTADMTVAPLNAQEIVKQWTNVHGLGAEPDAVETVDGYPRQVWRGPTGETVIEAYTITSMAHGTPLTTRGDALGTPGPFLLDVGISSSYHIARFWGLTGEAVVGHKTAEPPTGEDTVPSSGMGTIVRKALKAMGLLKS